MDIKKKKTVVVKSTGKGQLSGKKEFEMKGKKNKKIYLPNDHPVFNTKKEDELTLDDISRPIRPQLGEQGVILWRLMRRLALPKVLGKATAPTTYMVGKTLGKKLNIKKIDDFYALCLKLGVGILWTVKQTPQQLIMQIDECVTCSGTPNIGKAICDFELGIGAGVCENIYGKRVKGTETKCNGLGSGTCWLEYTIE